VKPCEGVPGIKAMTTLETVVALLAGALAGYGLAGGLGGGGPALVDILEILSKLWS
jgi:hypothetical protein